MSSEELVEHEHIILVREECSIFIVYVFIVHVYLSLFI